MDIKLKKVYTVSKKGKPAMPRLFLQHLVCETANFSPRDAVYILPSEEKQQIILQNYPFDEVEEEDIHTVHVSSRKSKISEEERPLVDTAGERYSFLDINQKVEITVFRKGKKGRIIVRPLEYSLFENSTIPTPKDKRIRLLSVCAGGGIGTSVLANTGYFSPIQEIELEDDSAELLVHNFPNSMVNCSDLRDVQDIAEVDCALITHPCSEHSTLAFGTANIMNDLVIATAKIIESSKASVLLFENVPQYYKSAAWESLKSLLKDQYPFWAQKEIEAWDFGSIATRKRIYSVAFRDEQRFLEFQFPTPPKGRRKKLKDFLDGKNINHEWKSVAAWEQSFFSREAWKNRSLDLTFVDKNAEKISCIPKRYSSHCASNSYVLSEDKKSWRLLSINEIRKILGVPDSFTFTDHIQKIRKYEILGQSVDGNVLSAIANRIAYCFMKVKDTVKQLPRKSVTSYIVSDRGQLELILS